MKTTLRSRSYLLLFGLAVALLLGAAPEAPPSGKFLVLRNGRTLEGDIQLVDGQYRVCRSGGETLIPVSQVLCLFRDAEEAYQFLRGKANLNDADERLRLARWCLDYNLRPQVEEEASAALAMRPNDAEAKHLLERVRQVPEVAPRPPLTPTPLPNVGERGGGEGPPPPVVPAPAVELTPEAMGQFSHKVQPILMNVCASCHANGHGGSFKLTKVSDIPTLKRRATEENLAAVLGQINYAQPQLSPLLTRAISIHGGGNQAPLKSRQVVPYQTLEGWLRLTLATNPQLQERTGIAVVPPPAPKGEDKSQKSEVSGQRTEDSKPNGGEFASTSVPQPAAVKPPEGGDDAYDPSEFNRQAHPEREAAPKP